jgi:hypothetical protein
MSAPRDIGVVIDEMLDHIGYVTAKAADRSADEFRLDRDI